MGPNQAFSLLHLALAGLVAATAFVPFRGIKRWSWEVYWLVQSVVALVIAPLLLARLLVPQVFQLISHAFALDSGAMIHVLIFGAAWGVGVMMLGLAVRFLGFALSLGLLLCVECGLAALGLAALHHSALLLGGSLLAAAALVLLLLAGAAKDKEIAFSNEVEAGESLFDFRRGAWLACVAGALVWFYAAALVHGHALSAESASTLLASGRRPFWASLPLIAVLSCGAFLANLVWTGVLLARHRSAGQLGGTPGVNPMRTLAISGNTMPYFNPEDPQYSERLSGSTLLGNYGLAGLAGLLFFARGPISMLGQVGWFGNRLFPLFFEIGCVAVFAVLWGLGLREWRGTSARTQGLFYGGIALLLVAAGVAAQAWIVLPGVR